MGILRSIANVLRSALFTVRRILVRPWKDPNSTGLPGPELGAGEREAFSQPSSSEVRRPSTAPVPTSSRREEISNSQEQVKANEQKKIEPEILLPPRQVVSFPSLATPQDSTPSKPVDKAVPSSRLPESDPDVSSSQKEQEPPTENTALNEKILSDISIPKQPAAESEGKESDEKIQV